MVKVLILGGGFGGIETFLRLHKYLHPINSHGLRVEMISRTNYFTYTPMLHEAATGSVAREHVVQPLREILSCCGKDFHQAEVLSVDPVRKMVHTSEGPHMYDILVVALGVEQGYFNTPGAAEHSLPLKWLPDSIAIRNRIIESYEKASEMNDVENYTAMRPHLHFVIVGGGATGTELAGQLADLAQKELRTFYADVPEALTHITLVHAGQRLLENLSPEGSQKAKDRLEKMGVKVMLNAIATEIDANSVHLKSGDSLPTHNVFWTAGTEGKMGQLFPVEFVNERGLLKVTSGWQVAGLPSVFAVGDCTTTIDKAWAYPPSAQAAVQEGRIVAENIIRHLAKVDLIRKPYKDKGNIIPIGNWYAIFEQKNIHFSGFIAWWFRRAVFLYTMYSGSKRLKVLSDWIIQMFEPRDTSEF